MTRSRLRALMRRTGLSSDPLAHCTDEASLTAALAALSDAELLAAIAHLERERIAALSDAGLLAELQALDAELYPIPSEESAQ